MKRLEIPKLTYSHSSPRVEPAPWSDEALVNSAFNIASYLPARAGEQPHAKAVLNPEGYDDLGKRSYSHLTFAQLNRLCDAYAHGLRAQGFERGDRTLLMVRQGLELIALTFALFKIGAPPILIDPGMGRKSFLNCIREAEPNAMIGIPRAYVAKLLFSGAFKSVEKMVSTRSVFYSSAAGLPEIAQWDAGPFEAAPTERDTLAAILFTSGSTGPPKGVEYTHGIFDSQVRSIQSMYAIQPGEVAVPGFPLFALFSTAMGMTCVIPDMDPSAPAAVDPGCIAEAILDHGADMAFGSPAIWVALARYCQSTGVKFETLSRLLTFGAAIDPRLMEVYREIAPNCTVHTPYGATESLPVATISSEEVLGETAQTTRKGRGICVGRPVDSIDVRIIEISDDPIEVWADVRELAAGEIGEICVRGPQVTARYDNNPGATRASKIADDESFWHRMGDLGYFDDLGRLWFCGRKSHRVITSSGPMFTVMCEAIFNAHPDVHRTALVGLGTGSAKKPAIVVEPTPEKYPGAAAEARFVEELRELGRGSDLTAEIDTFLFHRGFPVDKRHNAKIHRLELADWATRQLG